MPKAASSIRTYALAAMIALGLTFAWCALIVWIVGIVESASYRHRAYEQLYVSKSGEVHILRYAHGIYASQQEVLDISREPAKVDARSLLRPTYVAPRSTNTAVNPLYRLAAMNDGGVPATLWYLVHDGKTGGAAYGIGYHSVTKRVVGYFGRKGFTDRLPARDDWFPVAGRGLLFSTPTVTWMEPGIDDRWLYLLSGGKLWSIDSRERAIRILGDVPAEASIGWALDLKDPMNATIAGAPSKLLIRSNDACLLVQPNTGEQTRYPLPPEVRKELFAACQLPDGNLLLLANRFVANRDGQRVLWIEPGGRVLRTKDLHVAQLGIGGGEETFAWLSAVAVPFLAGQAAILSVIPTVSLQSQRSDSYWEGFGQVLGYFWPALLVLVAISGIGAVAAYRRQKRFALPGALGWAVFAFLFGVPGWISFRFHRTWPVLEECPTCQQAAPRDRDSCIECGARFPTPALKGIEVFA